MPIKIKTCLCLKNYSKCWLANSFIASRYPSFLTVEHASVNATISSVPVASIHTKNNKHSNNHGNNYTLKTISIFGIVATILGTQFFQKKRLVHAAGVDPKSPFKGSSFSGGSRRSSYNFIADVVDIVGSAVVFIERLQRIPFIRHAVPVSNGSGFIVDADGLIITNAHVVGNQSLLKVKLPDGREFEGRVVGIDESRDIAAVKIEAHSLPVIALGTTQDLRPGEWVVAIGSPLALKNTVTSGIVSNMCRAGKELGLHDEEKRDMEYIQTDATINVGNSGGPLVNLDGQVIGINTMMASAGIGFAIPIDYVKDFLKALQQGRGLARVTPTRRWLGITMLSLTPEIAMQLKLKKPDFPDISEGVYVHKVHFDSPAYLAGMQDGDVITQINETVIRTGRDVMDALKRDNVLNIKVRRRSRTIVLRVVAEELVH